jgi:hypothetical protein
MSGRNRRLEGKRKLFHAITSRIVHHKTDSREDMREEIKEEVKDNNIHSPYNDSTNTNINVNTLNYGYEYINNNGNHNNQQHDETQLEIKQPNTTLPVTQGSDNTNFSYLESIKRAPNKKKQGYRSSEMKTPTLNLKMRNKEIRNALSNNNNHLNTNTITNNNNLGNNRNNQINDALDYNGCSPVTEMSANSEMSFVSKTDSLLINNQTNNDDINEYDYKMFSSNHPIRFSKVKAFEQGEMTTKMYFSKFYEHNEIDVRHGKNNNNFQAIKEINDEIVVQIPQLSEEETRSLLGYKTEEKLNNNINQSVPKNSVERRIFLMKNALKPISKEQLVLNKLKESDLPQIFHNTGEFLKTLEPEELEFWELMNDEFENGLQELQSAHRREQENHRHLVDSDTVQAISCAAKRTHDAGKESQNVDGALSGLVRKRIKEVLQEEDQFQLSYV